MVTSMSADDGGFAFATRHSLAELRRRVGSLEQVAGVRLVTCADGPARGSRILEFRSGGGLRFEVLVDRGFDIGHASMCDRTLSWVSPVGHVAPWFREPAGYGWLRTFGGGLVTTCGLDHSFGPRQSDASHFGYPAIEEVHLPLHGRVSSEPATLTSYGVVESEEGVVLRADGIVRQAAVFGEVLELRRRIECDFGRAEIRIEDCVRNVGYRDTPHRLLYHVNLGFPLIDESTTVAVDSSNSTTESRDVLTFGGPTIGTPEEVLQLRPEPDRNGMVRVRVDQRVGGLRVEQRYDATTLPYLLIWKVSQEGMYVLGVEPSTDPAPSSSVPEATLMLGPGEERSYKLALSANPSQAANDTVC